VAEPKRTEEGAPLCATPYKAFHRSIGTGTVLHCLGGRNAEPRPRFARQFGIIAIISAKYLMRRMPAATDQVRPGVRSA